MSLVKQSNGKRLFFRNLQEIEDFLFSNPSLVGKHLHDKRFLKACNKAGLLSQLMPSLYERAIKGDMVCGKFFLKTNESFREKLLPCIQIGPHIDPRSELAKKWANLWQLEHDVYRSLIKANPENIRQLTEYEWGYDIHAFCLAKMLKSRDLTLYKDEHRYLKQLNAMSKEADYLD